MLEELGAPARSRPGEEHLEIVTGHQAIGACVRDLLDAAAEELLILGHPSFDWSAGVPTRWIQDPEEKSRAGAEQVRICAQLPTDFVVADRAVALVPVTDVPDSVLVVRSPALLVALVRLFELLWQSSVPVSRRAAEPPDEERADERLLLLLVAGLKDEAIARRLGVSLRTVHRRTSELLDRLGARTRFQAGVEAVRSGMLLGEGIRAAGHHR